MIPTNKTEKNSYSWMWIFLFLCMFVKTINIKIRDFKSPNKKCIPWSATLCHICTQFSWFDLLLHFTEHRIDTFHFSTNQLLSKTNNMFCVSLAFKAQIQSLQAHTHYSLIRNQRRYFFWYRNIIEVFKYFHLSWNFFHFPTLFIWFVFAIIFNQITISLHYVLSTINDKSNSIHGWIWLRQSSTNKRKNVCQIQIQINFYLKNYIV